MPRAPLLAPLLALAGCVTVYQPLSGLHRPIAIDPGRANFADTAVILRCVPGPSITEEESGTLCRKVSRLFENQGARVEVRRVGQLDDDLDEPAEAPAKHTLHVELSARVLHRDTSSVFLGGLPSLWGYVADFTFAQDVRVRDASGFLLAQETLTGRFISKLGFFSDAEEDFSRDFYGQLSQIALNARMRQSVLAEAAPGGAGEAR